MPRDGSGQYTLPAGNPVVTNTIITSVWANSTLADIAAQLNNVYTRDGLLGSTGSFKISDGTALAPGIAFNAEPDLGIYRSSQDVLSIVDGGTAIWTINAADATSTVITGYPRSAGGSVLRISDQPSGSANATFASLSDVGGYVTLSSSAVGSATKPGLVFDFPTVQVKSGGLFIDSGAGGNSNLFIRDDAGTNQGVLYWNRGDDNIRLTRYGAGGTVAEGELMLTASDAYYNGAKLLTTANTTTGDVNPTAWTLVQRTGSADITARYLGGGPGGAGNLRTYGNSNSVNFRWDGSLYYRVDEALDRKILTNVDFSVPPPPSFGQAWGYATMVGGLIIQWGRVVASDDGWAGFNLPMAFPNNILAVTTTLEYNGPIGGNSVASAHATMESVARIDVGISANFSLPNCGVTFIALGY